MLGKFDRIGEKTLNRIAEVALLSQLDRADQFTVQIKTDPSLLAKGILESLAIAGQGLQINSSLQMQEMKIVLDAIAVSPFKALMGNIQLTQPSQGTACFTLNEADITSALKVTKLQQQLANYRITLDGQPVTVAVKSIHCRLLGDRQLEIKANFLLQNPGEIRTVTLLLAPRVCAAKQGIVLDDYTLGQDSDPQLSLVMIHALLTEVSHILNLRDFQMDGFSLKIKGITIAQGQIKLEADAGITHIPNSLKQGDRL
jgi:hypothetical protein